MDEWKQDEHFESVPLTLNVGGETIIDDETFNQSEFLKKVAACETCPKSACPSPEQPAKVKADNIRVRTRISEMIFFMLFLRVRK